MDIIQELQRRARMPSHVLAFVKAELKSYPASKLLLAECQRFGDELRDHLKAANLQPRRYSEGQIHDPVGEQAVMLMMLEKPLERVEWYVTAIDFVLTSLSYEERMYIRYRYFEGQSMNYISLKLHRSASTLHGKEPELLERFADWMGLL